MADLKQLARRIFHETLAAIDISAAMQKKLLRTGTRLKCGEVTPSFDVDLAAFDRVFVVAIGKAAHAMVDGLAALIGDERAFEGVVAAPVAPQRSRTGVKYFIAGHP